MKFFFVIFSIILVLILGFLALRILNTPTEIETPYTTTLKLTGTEGAAFTGYYLAEGKRVELSNVLPYEFSAFNMSEFEIRKTDPSTNLVIEARGGVSMINSEVSPGSIGVKMDLQGGWSVESIIPGED